ncbi:MAG: NAD(P)H-hydrate dehydratase, partial [Clostridiales bacterium]
MPGAAILAAGGAARIGAGKVSGALPRSCRIPFTAQLPEALLLDLADNEEGGINVEEKEAIAAYPVGAYVLGPGMGRSESTLQLIRELLPLLNQPTVLDADALFAVCGYLRLLKNANSPLVITPHPGEMAKLLGVSIADVQANRVNVVVVLKGAGTVIATPDGRVAINSTGNPGMATGGSGDVLAGMIATLLAQGIPPASAAACAVWIHGKAGDIAAAKSSQPSLLAGDLLRYIGDAYQALKLK